MNCQKCDNPFPRPQSKFCPLCGTAKVQQAETAVTPAMQQPAFQPHLQQLDNKSTPAWIMILSATAITLFLLLSCGVLALFPGSSDELSSVVATDTNDIPSDDEIIAHLEDRYGINFTIVTSYRSSDFPRLYLTPINQADMDFLFTVKLVDWDGIFFSLDEIEDGFLFALAGSRIENTVFSLAEDMFGRESIEEVFVSCKMEDSWLRDAWCGVLPQNISWNLDDEIGSFRQRVVDELGYDISAYITIRLSGVDDVLWEQLEELAEEITASGYHGISNFMTVDELVIGAMTIGWRVQDGEIVSFERMDW